MESDRANRGANRGLRGHEKRLLARAQGITRPAAHPRTVGWRKRDETENDDGVCGVRAIRWPLFRMRHGESQRQVCVPDAAYRES